ncbi:MAG: hypothetical protein JST46_17540 [Bacteroidetes bacterium]|nr:hypothetical protein [Bacteroidota bacterium]
MNGDKFALISALRRAAARIHDSKDYQWGHMGRCNCGFLAQELTPHSDREIHSAAMQRHGDWSEQLNDYCPTSGSAMDDLIASLLAAGLKIEDLIHLERLSDPEVLAHLPGTRKYLHHNIKEDAALYMDTWATLLEFDTGAVTINSGELSLTVI